MSESEDRYQAAYNQLNETLVAVQAEHERLHATSETAEQNLGTFADAIAAAADSLRATIPQQPEAPAESA